MRLTLNESTGRLVIHGGTGERDLMPDEIERVREALEPKPLPWWLEYGTVAAVIGAMAWLGHGIGKGM